MALMGIDVGTSGCKVALISEKGEILSTANCEYEAVAPRPGYQELDPQMVFDKVLMVMRQVTEQMPGVEIQAISVNSIGEAMAPIDAQGNVLHNGILYTDKRGNEEVAQLKRSMDMAKFRQIAGIQPANMYSLCKLMFLKKHKPEVYEKTYKFLLFADFIIYKLGGAPCANYTLAARTMSFDVVNKRWSQEILDAGGIDINKMAEPVQPGTVVGELRGDYVRLLKLKSAPKLVLGAHDQTCAALGAGVTRAGVAVDGLGSVECIVPAFAQPVTQKEFVEAWLACVPHAYPGLYVTYGFTYTGARAFKWLCDSITRDIRAEAAQKGVSPYPLLIERMAADSGGVFFLPYLAGAATPYMNEEIRGAFTGLSLDTGPAELTRAVLEGITYEIMVNVQVLKNAGVPLNEIRAVGGLAKSDIFLQMKADMMGVPISTINTTEGGVLGVSMLSAVAVGIYPDLDAVVEDWVKVQRVFEPDPARTQYYAGQFQKYRQLYPAIDALTVK